MTLPRKTSPAIAHVATSLDMGGAQTMLAKLVEAAAGRPTHPRHVVLSLMPPGVIAARLAGVSCPVYDLGMRRGWPTPNAVLRLLRIAGALDPDILQGWMYHGNVAASLAGAVRRTPVIWNVRHSLGDPARESRGTRMLLRWSARISASTRAIVYNSRVAADQHEAFGFSAERRLVVPNGFDCTRFAPQASHRRDARALFGIAPEPLLVAMVARLHPMKDHATLLHAVGRARRAGHDIHLLLVGTGLDAPPRELARTIAQVLPADRVTVVGERTDVPDWLASIDVVALSSAWGEAFPNILGEAMACGVPCVATDVGDCGWIVGQGGAIVPPGDAAAMAEALIAQATIGPDARRRIGLLGRARVIEHFSLEEVARQYLLLYRSVLDQQEPSPAGADAPLRPTEARRA